jgi:hypothetical protein
MGAAQEKKNSFRAKTFYLVLFAWMMPLVNIYVVGRWAMVVTGVCIR